jgi:glycosyltransferase involved in cell wall biosynthesis
MVKMVVTVLIDTYNYGHFIGEAIQSVFAQEFPSQNLEILVVDDGSTDDTKERVTRYGDRIRYLYKPNGGQASAFNLGIARARGEYVALLDADDYWLPAKLRRVMEAFDKNPGAGLVYHRFREYLSDTGEWREGGLNDISGDVAKDRTKILQYTATQTSGLTFRTSVVREFLPLNEAMTIQSDGLLAALAIFLAPVVAIPEALAVYRIHEQNLYYQSAKDVDVQRQKRRLNTLRVLLDEMDLWLTRRGFDLREPAILAFRRRWRQLYETEEFLIEPPGRLRFFSFLVRSMRNMNPCLNWRIQAVNGLNAIGSLFVGYKNYPKLDDWRFRLKRGIFGT